MKRVLMTGAVIAVALGGLVKCTGAAEQRGQTTPPAAQAPQAAAFDSNKAYEHLRQMVGIGPRPSGSAALRQTRAYITRQLSAEGLTVEEQKFTPTTPKGPIEMTNLIVKMPGRRTDRILITGHYDTKDLPRFVGASDGASSAAILIELARVLKGKPHEYTYEFIWFDGEEAVCKGWDECGRPNAPDNTYGSRYYVDAAKKANALSGVKAMILFDMIGARDLKLPREIDMSTPWLIDIVWATAKKLGHGSIFVDTPGGVGGDDHEPFWKAGIPTLDIIDLNDYPQWHNDAACCDDLEHVSARSLQIVGDVFLASLPEIEKHLMGGR